MTTATMILEAGRELDALVAEKVFGRVPKRLKGLWYFDDQWSWDDKEHMRKYGDLVAVVTSQHLLPEYSISIGAAWEVVERMIALGFDVDQLSFTPAAIDKQEWQAAFSTKPVKGDRLRMRRLFFEFDPSLPRAICLAALKAVEAL